MENATKALLIAAAILIAIVLVSIGVFVLRQGQDAMSAADMSEAEKLAFNSKFESYGGQQRGSQVNALVERVITSNRQQTSGDVEGAIVTVSGVINVTEAAPTTKSGDIKTAQYYNVKINKSPATGLVETIQVTNPN